MNRRPPFGPLGRLDTLGHEGRELLEGEIEAYTIVGHPRRLDLFEGRSGGERAIVPSHRARADRDGGTPGEGLVATTADELDPFSIEAQRVKGSLPLAHEPRLLGGAILGEASHGQVRLEAVG